MGLTLHCRKEKRGLKLVRCYGNDGAVVLPDTVDGQSLKFLGDYAFSEWKKREEEDVEIYKENQDTLFEGETELLCGSRIKSVQLSHRMEELGKYAFYGCSRLKKLTFTDALKDTSTGVFHGCRLRQVEIFCNNGKSTCLKEIVGEIRYELYADLHYRTKEGTVETAKLVFPEFYEEAVENTPARIIEKYFNGSGYKYRQCFRRREVDYPAYDQLFAVAVIEERPELVSEIAIRRLRYPYELGQKAKKEYTVYVKDHAEEISKGFIKQHDMDSLRFLSENNFWNEQAMEAAVEQSAEQKDGEVMSFLMNEKRRLFPPKKKIFEF